MLTPWGESVGPDNAWTEYPRPQFVRDGWTNLNGTWQYAVRPQASPMPATWDGDILVPFCIESRLSGVMRRVGPDERLWYRRTFSLPPSDRRTLLHFGAVDYRAIAWINEVFVAAHEGGFDPFSIDVTRFLRAGANELVLGVDDPTSTSDQPRGKQHLEPQGIWYTPVTGIWQTVWLEQVPADHHIAELRVTPDPDAETVEVQALLGSPSADPGLAVEVTVRLAGEIVATVVGRPDRRVLLSVPAARHWSPAEPTLYDLEVNLGRIPDPLPGADSRRAAGGPWREVPARGDREAQRYAAASRLETVIDTVRSYFGFRTVCVGAAPGTGRPALLLNGEPTFHLATLDQGWWPDGLHTPPADAAIVFEIEFLKAAGFNAVRKHIKVEPDRYYYHCDRLGLLVWQDMPSGHLPPQFIAPNDEGEGLRTSTGTETYERELARMVRRLREHPSIVAWVLHNEGWGQFDSERLVAFVRGIDPSRPIDATSGWLDLGAGDMIDRHDYRPEPKAPRGDGRRVPVIGEFGGLGLPVEGHLWNPEMRNWGYQALDREADLQAAYARALAAIGRGRAEQGICAAVYTQTTDVEGEVNGLLTYDRRVEKLARSWLAEIHRGFLSGAAPAPEIPAS